MSNTPHIVCVVGARPNFMKMGPVVLELARRGLTPVLIHTGQHYDDNMSRVFFDELGLPRPDVYLGVGSGTHAHQTATVMTGLEDLWLKSPPDLVVVAGDVNSTMAATLVATKLHIPVAHIESGLRSGDRTMPEEINRLVTDAVADLLFTTEASANEHLAREGVAESRIHFVGNCMIDTLEAHRAQAVAAEPWKAFDLAPGGYGLVTLHRPANVDDDSGLRAMVTMLEDIAETMPLIFPVHPRTRSKLGERPATSRLRCVDPLPYLAFTGLMAEAAIVLTDSGGVQEETTALGVPCITMRDNTERPVTMTDGTNILAGTDPRSIHAAALDVLEGRRTLIGKRPPLWDGRAAVRVVDVVEAWWKRQPVSRRGPRRMSH